MDRTSSWPGEEPERLTTGPGAAGLPGRALHPALVGALVTCRCASTVRGPGERLAELAPAGKAWEDASAGGDAVAVTQVDAGVDAPAIGTWHSGVIHVAVRSGAGSGSAVPHQVGRGRGLGLLRDRLPDGQVLAGVPIGRVPTAGRQALRSRACSPPPTCLPPRTPPGQAIRGKRTYGRSVDTAPRCGALLPPADSPSRHQQETTHHGHSI